MANFMLTLVLDEDIFITVPKLTVEIKIPDVPVATVHKNMSVAEYGKPE